MGTTIHIQGAIDRQVPDPALTSDPTRTFLGMITASWNYDGPRSAMAAVIKVATGGGMVTGWGPHVLCLRWVGDPPMVEVAQAVYDALRDRGPTPGPISMAVVTTAQGPELASYRRAG